MVAQALKQSDFKETYAVHAAIRNGLRTKLFRKDTDAKRAAEHIIKHLESDKSIYGRQLRMIQLMRRGATIAQLRKGLHCSRRTVFRYFLDLERAGIDIKLEGSSYGVDKGMLKLVT